MLIAGATYGKGRNDNKQKKAHNQRNKKMIFRVKKVKFYNLRNICLCK